MENKRAEELLKKFRAGQCTEQEKALLESWYIQRASRSEVDLSADEIEAVLQEIWATLPVHDEEQPVRRLWPRIAAAASILLMLSAGGYFLLHKTPAVYLVAQNHVPDIAPGSNKAILTLSNGKKLNLTDAKTGVLSKQGNKLIKKTSDGTVSYEASESDGDNRQPGYNTIVTPQGGQWSVILPDGSRAMLDAASSIKYPVSFSGYERRVEITGQVYFEVVHNAANPFRVIVKDQVVEDIGTKFNINAYDDEPVIKTTLLEGGVKVSNPSASLLSSREGILLKPGQQAAFQNNRFTVAYANVEDALAWKNGYFSFNDEKTADVMRKLSRWYAIEIRYQGNVPDQVFEGTIPRNTPLSQVLKVLEEAKLHFTLDGKVLTIKP